MIIVFNMYLENGTHESFIKINKSEKFSSVGFRTAIATILFLLMVGTNMLVQRLLRRVGE